VGSYFKGRGGGVLSPFSGLLVARQLSQTVALKKYEGGGGGKTKEADLLGGS